MMYQDPPARLFLGMKLAAALATAVVVGLIGVAPAEASHGPSFRDCVNSWKRPGSHTANMCRSRGWVVSNRLVVGPRAVVRHNTLRTCSMTLKMPCFRQEQTRRFYVDSNLNRHYVRRAFYLDQDGDRHYVWQHNPTRSGEWSWVNQDVGGHGLRCVLNYYSAKYEKICPRGGYRIVLGSESETPTLS